MSSGRTIPAAQPEDGRLKACSPAVKLICQSQYWRRAVGRWRGQTPGVCRNLHGSYRHFIHYRFLSLPPTPINLPEPSRGSRYRLSLFFLLRDANESDSVTRSVSVVRVFWSGRDLWPLRSCGYTFAPRVCVRACVRTRACVRACVRTQYVALSHVIFKWSYVVTLYRVHNDHLNWIPRDWLLQYYRIIGVCVRTCF